MGKAKQRQWICPECKSEWTFPVKGGEGMPWCCMKNSMSELAQMTLLKPEDFENEKS